jgi:hypothetical protein
MRRPSGLVLPALLAALVGLTLLAGPALAADPEAEQSLVLAVEAEGNEPLGPNPAPRDAADNPARELGGYTDQETPFTWGAAWILAATGVIGLLLLAGLYELRVRRPAKQAAGAP